MKISEFNKINWFEIVNNRNEDWKMYAYSAGKRDSKEFIDFKKLYDTKYYRKGDRGLYHTTYVRLLGTVTAIEEREKNEITLEYYI